jgi:phytoene desaturase (3,4-didehydrolycopene-forming)
MKKSVIIIGAGCGGITTGVLLAKSGYEVTILEANDYLGGRCSDIRFDGLRFDQGPSIYLLPDVYERVYDEIDPNLKNQIELIKCEPSYHVWDEDKFLVVSTDQKIMNTQLNIHGEDLNSIDRFITKLKTYYKHTTSLFFNGLFFNLVSFLINVLKRIWYLDILNSEFDTVKKFFRTDTFIHAFSFASMYFGMSPYTAPAPFLILQYSELDKGVFYPRGGMYGILDKMIQIGLKYDLTIKTKCNVISIENPSSPLKKVIYEENGIKSVLEANIIISNVDAAYAYEKLFPDTYFNELITKSIKSMSYSCSTISFYWGLNISRVDLSKLAVNNLFLNGDYKGSYDKIFKLNSIPDEPSFYLNIPYVIDQSASETGVVPAVILVPVGPKFKDMHNKDLDKILHQTKKFIIDKIFERTQINLSEAIVSEQINHPGSWESKFNLTHGSALGPSHHLTQSGFFRTSNLTSYDNIYLIGSSVQMGIGVPTVMLSSLFLTRYIVGKIFWDDLMEKIYYYTWSIYLIIYSRIKSSGLISMHQLS